MKILPVADINPSSLFDYDENLGVLIWKERYNNNKFNGRYANKPAGCLTVYSDNLTYIQVRVKHKLYLAHRIIWYMLYGEEPNIIDHVDGDGLNNRPDNLRNTDITNNQRNLRMNKTNTSGITGVSKFRDKWQAGIWVDNKRVNLGVFNTFEEAVKARKYAEVAYDYHPNHGTRN